MSRACAAWAAAGGGKRPVERLKAARRKHRARGIRLMSKFVNLFQSARLRARSVFAAKANAGVSARASAKDLATPIDATDERFRRAIECGELQLYYQPLTDIKTGLITGAEALVRWNEPDRGFLLPAQFVPYAEETGAIIAMGDWVLRTACAQLKTWHESGLLDLRVSVNVSAKQFESLEFVETVASALKKAHLAPEFLELEITETTAMKNLELSIAVMSQLHKMDVRLAIDDFGTGYSSLASLKQFPLDELKIDRMFIRNCTSDPDDAAITMAVISLAHGMGLNAVAEGVETQRQLEYLRTLQCNTMQGILGGSAMPAEAFTRFVRGEDDPYGSIAALP